MDGDKTLTANFTWPPPTIYTFEDDRDGTTYKWVQIGTQKWMAENLNYNASGSKCLGNNSDNCERYGRLYNWSTAMDNAPSSSLSPSGVQGVCPAEWHIPSAAEWTALTDYVGSNASTKLKSSTGWEWSSIAPVGTDEYGWSALPGRKGSPSGNFSEIDVYYRFNGYWRSATETEDDANYASYRSMYYNNDPYSPRHDKTYLFSVRCVAD
jgi:uncharacterized protein (TIGR02145 family)